MMLGCGCLHSGTAINGNTSMIIRSNRACLAYHIYLSKLDNVAIESRQEELFFFIKNVNVNGIHQ